MTPQQAQLTAADELTFIEADVRLGRIASAAELWERMAPVLGELRHDLSEAGKRAEEWESWADLHEKLGRAATEALDDLAGAVTDLRDRIDDAMDAAEEDGVEPQDYEIPMAESAAVLAKAIEQLCGPLGTPSDPAERSPLARIVILEERIARHPAFGEG